MKLPIKQEKGGIIITAYELTLSKSFSCDGCWQKESCNLKRKCMDLISVNCLTAMEIVVGILNATEKPIYINAGKWEFIDSEGFAYGACSPCEMLQRPRFVCCSDWSVSPGTQVKIQLLFPEIEDGKKPLALLYADNTTMIRLNFAKPSKSLMKLFSAKEAAKEAEITENVLAHDYELKVTVNNVKRLKEKVFSRFNNSLSNKEKTSLDNDIVNLIFSIGEFAKKSNQNRKEYFYADYLSIKKEYEDRISVVKEQEQKSKTISLKVEELLSLQPREFEEWTQSLFIALNYKNVVLTPSSGDKGIDIRAEKDGKLIAIQCKKYKGVIGTPILQGFIGAMQTEGFDKGFIITTGVFSVGAEKMVEGMPVELYDKVRLKELIEEAMKL